MVDILGAGIASSSCKEAAIEAMNTQVENVTLVDQSFCQYELGTEEYEKSPCCAVTAEAIDCCIPFTIAQNQEQFTTANSSTCGVSECANTYFEDLAHSLNHVKDLVQGCSSGIKVFPFLLFEIFIQCFLLLREIDTLFFYHRIFKMSWDMFLIKN